MVQTATPTTPRKPTKKEAQDIISLRQFSEWIPDEAAAVAYVEERRWGDNPYCPLCGLENVYEVKSGKPMSHRCRSCKRYFSVRTGTVMAETNLPIRTWLLAIHLIHTGRKGTSAMQLHKLLGVAYSTAWFLGHRIREAMKRNEMDAITSGWVEVDETYVGGKEKNKHASKKTGNPMDNKYAVIGMKAHDGNIIAFPVSHANHKTIQDAILDNVNPGVMVYTDGHPAYSILSQYGYGHEWVNHSTGEYVNGMASTNGIESFWALLKRGYVGTFHLMSWKHLHRYVTEFASRHNAGPGNGIATIGSVVDQMVGKRLTYEALTA